MYYPQKGLQEVKPYNPILGEEFKCSWDHQNSVSTCLCEQVKHHPPISSLYLENKKWGFYYQQTIQPLTTFWGTKTATTLEADNRFKIVELDEEYTSQDPQAIMRNLLFGTSILEHSDKMVVDCKKTGLYAVLQFPEKSNWSVNGFVFKRSEVEGEKATPLFKLEGSMRSTVDIINLKNQAKRAFAQYKDSPRHPEFEMQVKPVSEQAENESRRVWHDLTYHLVKRDLSAASDAKTVVEEHQRALRKQRPSDWKWKTHHKAKYFDNTGEIVGQGGTPKFEYKQRMTKDQRQDAEEEEMD